MRPILLFTLTILLGSFTCSSQLDSLHVEPAFAASQTSETGHTLALQISANDVGQIGALSIVLYDRETQDPLAVVEYSAAQIAGGGLIVNGKIETHIGEVLPTGTYTITASFQNLQLAYLPQIILQYPN